MYRCLPISIGALALLTTSSLFSGEIALAFTPLPNTPTVPDPTPLPLVSHRTSYTYTPTGNITSITDPIHTTTYTYDDLSRLTQASSSAYTRTYTYNPLGNLTHKSNVGTYQYNNANPHAATRIGSDTLTYDAAGNLLSDGSTEYTWNYKNQLVSSKKDNQVTTYTYDHTGRRVEKVVAGEVTHYPSSDYEVTGTTTTTHIYTNDALVATLEDNTIEHAHLDHLGSTRYMSDASGTFSQVLDYYPFGAERITEQHTDQNQTKRYTGHEYDEETELSYMGARYQSGEQGRFISQDPVSTALGNPNLMSSMTNIDLGSYLRKPQLHNSYSYAGNNPIKYVDKNGEFVFLIIPAIYLAVEIGFTAYDVYDVVKTLSDANSSKADIGLSVGGAALGLVLPAGGYGGGAKVAKNLTSGSLRTVSNVGAIEKRIDHVVSRHTINGTEFVAGNTSYFNNVDEVTNLIKSVNGQKGVIQPNGNVARTVQLDKNIGYDAVTKSDTNVVTVITKSNGDLVTAHPGPRRVDKKGN